MASQTKLLLVPCSGHETTELATEIFTILRRDYRLEDQVELLAPSRRKDVPKGTLKDHKHPLVSDFFADAEVQTDIGRNQLYDIIRGKHVALVEHLLTPNRLVYEGDTQRVSVNDHVMAVRGLLDLLKNTETLQRTLVAPYLTYVRSHSVDKYRIRGFFQFDSLHRMIHDWQKDGLGAILTIDPHSLKATQEAEDVGIDFHAINPFQSSRGINPYKLGLSAKTAKDVLLRCRPYQERIRELKIRKEGHLYIVVVDEGTEKRCENFVERAFPELEPDEFYSLLLYFSSDRVSYGDKTTLVQKFSQIREVNIDPQGTYIIIDDMAASLGTANGKAQWIKQSGGENVHVELWTSHAVTMPQQHTKANDRTFIDRVVCLDTVPQHPDLNIEYITASADLLAAGLYKAHQKLVASR
ncbi:hypothetical protein COV17_04500 [Candidatus Woesearchaeota archaeon CG10_big_fil_rev_8_21_14_0_10_36_11]|nr:MAG: hypothetical protein COV17_04500 [Candidatus Woesearchaeota archaeon CG10_big_fil_rev_8_21_14_0_10_36_11]